MNRRKAKKYVKKKFNIYRWPGKAEPRIVARFYSHFADYVYQLFDSDNWVRPCLYDGKYLVYKIPVSGVICEIEGTL